MAVLDTMSPQTARNVLGRAIRGADPWSVEVRDAVEALQESTDATDAELLLLIGRRRREAMEDTHESHNAGGTEDWSGLAVESNGVAVIGWVLFAAVTWIVLAWFLS